MEQEAQRYQKPKSRVNRDAEENVEEVILLDESSDTTFGQGKGKKLNKKQAAKLQA